MEWILNIENSRNKNDPITAKLWEKKLDTGKASLYVKKGGNSWDKI